MPLWLIVIFLMLLATVLSVFIASLKIRREFGSKPTLKEVRAQYPRAKIFRLWRK